MRPTDLKFRSPKERTEFLNTSQVTHQGKNLFQDSLSTNDMKNNTFKLKHLSTSFDINTSAIECIKTNHTVQRAQLRDNRPTFGKGERFPQYKAWATSTNTFIGPGKYNAMECYNKLKQDPCSAAFRDFTVNKQMMQTG